MSRPTVSVVIPTLNAESEIGPLVEALLSQTLTPREVLVIDSSSDDVTVAEATCAGARTYVIPRADFNHGATRHLGFSMTDSDYVCFMTQDAVPEGEGLLEALVRPMEEDLAIALVSGRQLPKRDARPFERLVREFNYPDQPSVRNAADVESLGIKAYFASDVCAAYRRDAYLEAGGFPAVETNEDMLMAARLIAAGYKVAYEPAACVYHSHNLAPRQQYARNKSVGRFLQEHSGELGGVSEIGEGGRLVKSVAAGLLREGLVGELVAFGLDCAARLAGNRAGHRSALNEQRGRR